MSSSKLLAVVVFGAATTAVAAYFARRQTSSASAIEAANKAGAGEEQKTGSGSRVERWLADRGVTGKKLTIAVFVHECLGMVLLSGTWACCYIWNPSVRLAGVLERAGLQGSTSEALAELGNAASRKVARIFGESGDTVRLTKSLAESMLIRAMLTPVTIPLKLLLTYSLVA